MTVYFNKLYESIQSKLKNIDLDGCDISIEEAFSMVEFLKKCLSDLRNFFLSQESVSVQEEIMFFKEMKPEVLGLLLYFNKMHSIELKRPTGSNDTQRAYYESKLSSITYFFEYHLDFYQYYRSKSTHFDEYYFVRGKSCPQLCADSAQYIRDPLFSTVYDFKIAKIISNEMLRIYLNKKLLRLEKQMTIDKNRALLPVGNLKWTGSKVAAVEFGYALHACPAINRGQADIKDIMTFIETFFNIDLGDYYRTYITIRGRKKDRTAFLNSLIDGLIKKMDEDDKN
jgi:hypothetical protein